MASSGCHALTGPYVYEGGEEDAGDQGGESRLAVGLCREVAMGG